MQRNVHSLANHVHTQCLRHLRYSSFAPLLVRNHLQIDLACGTPVVAFDSCGLPDIVTHKVSGYLAKAYDTESLAQGIQWVLNEQVSKNGKGITCISKNARNTAVDRFSYPVVSKKYLDVYKEVLNT